MALPTARPSREAGFTILEVLVAFVLFALTLGALLQLFSSGLRDAQLADEYARATMIAQSRLAGFTAAETLQEGAVAGRDDPFDWTLTATPYDERQEVAADQARTQPQAPTPVPGQFDVRVRLLRVESKVSWHAADGRERDVRLVTLVLGPKP